ncbi:MAG: aldo/keto reductase [Planctomycetes bacterium]|nr:aldo/keto reductase [Planctomycetota bacterium]
MAHRRLGKTGLLVSPIGFGAFKIGRNQGTKYPNEYDLPDEGGVRRLLEGVLDLGINLIDTAPAYGLSEQRIGRAVSHRRRDYVLSTKVGETFTEGRSTFDFSQRAVRQSVQRSLRRLKTDVIDLLLIHSEGNEQALLQDTDIVQTLRDLRDRGLVRAIGLSAKTVQGARAALGWADVIMVEYHLQDRSHAGVIAEAARADVGVLIKKGLASGRLDPTEAIRFVLETPGVSSLLVGGLSIDHLRHNIRLAETIDDKTADS